MPELPEVETIRLFLKDKIVGKKIKSIEILTNKSFRGDSRKIINHQITNLSRVGKQLSIFFDNNFLFLIHLKMTGQLIYFDKKYTAMGHPLDKFIRRSLDEGGPWKSTRVIFTFRDNSKLYFNDQRKFGWIRLLKTSQLPFLQSNLGPDILSLKFTLSYFQKVLKNSNRFIKTLLHDQSTMAGIGNIYANDALFLSRIHPQLRANKLTLTQTASLYKNIKKVIRQGINSGGSTAKDNMYVRPDGTPGANQYNFLVYQRVGEECLKCSTKITRLKLQGRSAFYCPNCQQL